MKVLIIGSGGREHALAWKCAASSRVKEVIVAPGNAGTATERSAREFPAGTTEAKTRNVELKDSSVAAMLECALREKPDLTIIGPEGPLVAGVVDAFAAQGLKCFGPKKVAAQLEGSKAFTKEFLQRHRIPTARSRTFTRETFDRSYIEQHPLPVVVKASGLASGKGVVIAESTAEALETIEAMLNGRFGNAGQEVVIEEFLVGEEASFIVMTDGRHVIPFATSQDHKRRDDGDHGPNTGGMGAYSPAPVVTPAVHARVMREVIEPTIRGLAADGIPYVGFLYAGLMIAPDGAPYVIEYNCRFGDPEAQPIMMRLKSDLTVLCEAAIGGRLDEVAADWDPRAALGVVLAAPGYPESVRSGDVIDGLDKAARLPGKVFHGGTQANAGGRVTTSGGRVLCAVGLGDSVREAQRQAYALAGCIHWPGMQYRRDIGYRAIARERS